MKKIFLYFALCIFLSGCFQSTAMVGPAVTLASTGNIYHAGISFGANKAVEEETGMTATEYVSKLIDEEKNKKKQKKIPEEFYLLVKSNIEKTRKLINVKKNSQ